MLHLKHLPNQKPGEKTILFLRRHWSSLLKILAITAAALLAPVVVIWLLGQVSPGLLDRPAQNAIASVFISIYYLSVLTFFFQEFVDYYLDTWIVTNERIINIEQHGLFNRVASELHLAVIQDISAEVVGPLHTFLDFGDVHVQTAGSANRFHFKDIPRPERVRETILRLSEADKQRHPQPIYSAQHSK